MKIKFLYYWLILSVIEFLILFEFLLLAALIAMVNLATFPLTFLHLSNTK